MVVELADEGVECLDAEIGGAVAEALSHEAVDPGSEVEWVGHGLELLGISTFVLIVAALGWGGEVDGGRGVGVDGGDSVRSEPSHLLTGVQPTPFWREGSLVPRDRLRCCPRCDQ